MVPETQKRPASLPAILAILSCKSFVAWSSPYTSSPRDAWRIRSNISSVGIVMVSLQMRSQYALSVPPHLDSWRRSDPST